MPYGKDGKRKKSSGYPMMEDESPLTKKHDAKGAKSKNDAKKAAPKSASKAKSGGDSHMTHADKKKGQVTNSKSMARI